MDAASIPLTMLSQGTDYELLSMGEGTSFVFRCKPDRMTAHLEGNDAIRFKAEYDALKAQFPGWQADQTLAQLWDQGGYSWLAVEEGASS